MEESWSERIVEFRVCRGGKWATVCARDDTRAAAIYTADGRGEEDSGRRLEREQEEMAGRNTGAKRRGGKVEGGEKRCNPDGTRIRMTHGIIWVYVIREIRRGPRTVTRRRDASLNRPDLLIPRVRQDHGVTLHLPCPKVDFVIAQKSADWVTRVTDSARRCLYYYRRREVTLKI